MKTFTIGFQSFTKKRDELTDILYSLEKAGISKQALRAGDKTTGGVAVFLDSNTSLDEVQVSIEQLKKDGCEGKIIVISIDILPMKTTWSLLKIGVSECFCWNNTEKPIEIVQARLAYWEIAEEKFQLLKKTLVGNSKVWTSTLRQLVDMAMSNSSALILGESGTGKELTTQMIHQIDIRPDKKDCVVVDCTNLMPGLSGSELFGHEKGAFTNAIATREGAIALANDGTLFLDELGELPLQMQAELLRVLQEGTYKRVGSNVWRKATFRLISATNRDLQTEVKNGTFRQDLYYRISGWVCRLPSLRERKEDIPLLVEHFFRKIHRMNQVIDQQVFDFLCLKDYPGNVRELQQLVNRIANKHIGNGPITIGDIPQSDWPDFDNLPVENENESLEVAVKKMLHQGVSLKDLKEIVTEIAKNEAIHNEKGNLKLAAQRLGCSERILQMHRNESPLRVHKFA